MKITFLGTSAAEGLPAVFCNCSACKRAKERGGREIRTRSQILVDGDTLFDFPMDTYMHMLMYGLDLSAVRRVLITHSHMDHCYPQEFCMRGGPFAHELTVQKIEVMCNSTVREIFIADTAREMRDEVGKNIEIATMHPFERRSSGDMTVIALPASHTVGEECLVYYIERAGAGALFLNDTGVLTDDVYRRLSGMGGHADIVALDCTYGARRHGPGRHMGLYDIADQMELIFRTGAAKQNAKCFATHFSHNTDLDYDGLVRAAEPLGVTIAYDGLEYKTE